ncbi:protein of unknown function [Pseudodesulfovibrio profundus]|uniref:Gamma-glutamylcyclotransferase AIG2-like domain-containing protein n=1 Tax=Pseudodesulfovibrio profundus TaxID=57320 RepID=A0A2C8FCZ3_9BACT|nr:protein of unknown function [Pseudodesulfovibrio profundus]
MPASLEKVKTFRQQVQFPCTIFHDFGLGIRRSEALFSQPFMPEAEPVTVPAKNIDDACRQQDTGTLHFGRLAGDWDLIHGELVTFTDSQRDLPPIDRLEGFRPDGQSMHHQVMVAVLCGRTPITAWTYWMPCPPYAERFASGEWLRP